MYKKLPLKINADITTDCRNFYRFSVIGTNSDFDSWIANHYTQLYLNKSDYKCYYGMGGKLYNQQEYFDAIIKTERAYINDFKSDDELIKFIVEAINANKYIQIECNTPTLIDKAKDFYIHEILIYGYDLNEKVFFCPMYNETKWEENKFSIESFLEAYNVRKEIANTITNTMVSGGFMNYAISIFSLRDNYKPYVSVEMLCADLKYILMKSYSVTKSTNCADIITYNGVISVINAYIDYCDKIQSMKLYYEYTDYKFPVSLKTLCEYISLFSKRMYIFEKHFDLNLSKELYNMLDFIEVDIKKAFNLAIKYSIDKKERNIIKIKEKLERSAALLNNVLVDLMLRCTEYIEKNN